MTKTARHTAGLLEACQAALDYIEFVWDGDKMSDAGANACRLLKAAISKAEGK